MCAELDDSCGRADILGSYYKIENQKSFNDEDRIAIISDNMKENVPDSRGQEGRWLCCEKVNNVFLINLYYLTLITFSL